jgi:hypothetical protein
MQIREGGIVQLTRFNRDSGDHSCHRLQDERIVEYQWAAALNINQEDAVEERNRVNLMGCMCRDATTVPPWLGPASDVTDETMTEMSHFGRIILRHLVKITPPEIAIEYSFAALLK